MWRTFASLGLTFAAIAWAIVSAALCFFYGSAFWIEYFGRFGAFYSALFAFGLCFIGARGLLRLADKIIEPYSGPFDASAYEASPPDTFYRDWQRYAGDVMRNRRYAFYARTRQWDKLRALEAETAAARRAEQAAPAASPPHPRRTTMANRVTFEENRRGARRFSAQARARPERWRAFDDDEALDEAWGESRGGPARRAAASAQAERLS
jgi:hypothetical protein